MAVYYRDKGDDEFTDLKNKRKAGQYYHSAAIFFHNLLLQYYESNKSTNNINTNPRYLKLKSNFDHCRERIKLCSDLLENLVAEHFLFTKHMDNNIISNDTERKPLLEITTRGTINDRESTFKNYIICENGKIVGEGGYGSVFVVKHKVSGAEFACKKIITKNMDFKKLGWLHHEIAIMKQVDHPNIIKLREVYYDCECVYLIMELCKGGDLATYMIDKIRRPLREHEAQKLLKDMVSSLRYLHSENIIHRDIKLENFVLHFDDDQIVPIPMVIGLTGTNNLSTNLTSTKLSSNQISQQTDSLTYNQSNNQNNDNSFKSILKNVSEVKLTDFGLAKYSDDYGVPVLAGSIPYIAPEIFNGENYDDKSDNWSLGVVAYIMLTGEMPFKGKTDEEVAKAIRNDEPTFGNNTLINTSNYNNSSNNNGRYLRGHYISAHAIDLVSKLLRKDRNQRITLDDAIEHPFFKQEFLVHTNSLGSMTSNSDGGSGSGIDITVSSSICSDASSSLGTSNSNKQKEWADIATSLRGYWSMCKFNKMLCKAVAFSLNPSQISELRAIFNSIDTDRNGYVSMEELRQVLLKMNCADKLNDLTTSDEYKTLLNENSEISYSDFIAAALVKRVSIDESQLMMAFEQIDQEGNGYLSTEAIQRAIGNYMSEDEIKEMIKVLDKDGDERIDYHEFIDHWRKITLNKNKPTFKVLMKKVMSRLGIVRAFKSTVSENKLMRSISGSNSASNDSILSSLRTESISSNISLNESPILKLSNNPSGNTTSNTISNSISSKENDNPLDSCLDESIESIDVNLHTIKSITKDVIDDDDDDIFPHSLPDLFTSEPMITKSTSINLSYISQPFRQYEESQYMTNLPRVSFRNEKRVYSQAFDIENSKVVEELEILPLDISVKPKNL